MQYFQDNPQAQPHICETIIECHWYIPYLIQNESQQYIANMCINSEQPQACARGAGIQVARTSSYNTHTIRTQCDLLGDDCYYGAASEIGYNHEIKKGIAVCSNAHRKIQCILELLITRSKHFY
jgi:hypothetical protein